MHGEFVILPASIFSRYASL